MLVMVNILSIKKPDGSYENSIVSDAGLVKKIKFDKDDHVVLYGQKGAVLFEKKPKSKAK